MPARAEPAAVPSRAPGSGGLLPCAGAAPRSGTGMRGGRAREGEAGRAFPPRRLTVLRRAAAERGLDADGVWAEGGGGSC